MPPVRTELPDLARTDANGHASVTIARPALPGACTGPMTVIDRRTLARDGAHALYLDLDADGGPTSIGRIESVASRRGDRPWTARDDDVARDTRPRR